MDKGPLSTYGEMPNKWSKVMKKITLYEMSTLIFNSTNNPYLPVAVTKSSGIADYFRLIPMLNFLKRRGFILAFLVTDQ